MTEEISCLRDRHGAGVSLLRPVQTLINPSPPPPLPTLLGAKDCGGLFGWEQGLCWQGPRGSGYHRPLSRPSKLYCDKAMGQPPHLIYFSLSFVLIICFSFLENTKIEKEIALILKVSQNFKH